MTAALLIAAALTVALCVQTLSSPLAGTWLFFFLAGCSILYKPPEEKSFLWKTCAVWLLILGVSTFVIAPVANGAATMWCLAAMPLLAICAREKHMKKLLGAVLVVLVVYALNLYAQFILQMKFTSYNYPSRPFGSYAWPLLDPNNAACVLNAGLIPCFYKMLRNWRWSILWVLFLAALFTTGSNAGALAGALGCGILFIEACGVMGALWVYTLTGFGVIFFNDRFLHSLLERVPVWKGCLPLLFLHPFSGLGLGSFSYYYAQTRIESGTGGWYAHDDPLQLAIEMGFPALLCFLTLSLAAVFTTCRRNIVSGCVLLAIALQGLVEFQFYLPSVSILAGLALAYHMAFCDNRWAINKGDYYGKRWDDEGHERQSAQALRLQHGAESGQ